jgi:hypothetical protein
MSRTIKFQDGDILIPSSGRPYLIDGSEKCEQDLAWQLMTEYNGEEGSEIAAVDRPVYATRQILISLIRQKVADAVSRLQNLQEDRIDQMTANELIQEIIALDVWQVEGLDFAFYVAVETEGGGSVDRGYTIGLGHQFPDNVTWLLGREAGNI